MSLKNLRESLDRIALVAARLNGAESPAEGYMALLAVALALGVGGVTLYLAVPILL